MSNSTPNQCPRCGGALPFHAPEGLCPRCLAQLPLDSETAMTGEPKAAPLPPISPAELAPHFPQLEILECLGRGGMGVVYKARQKSLNRFVALKLMAPERATDADFAKRFTREAHALAALSHPHIVTIHDFGRAGGFYFLLMEFIDGVNLRQAMTANHFTPEQALAVVPPICEALQYAHEHGIVHRDIKPENLLLDKEGRVKIADFGIAKMLGEDTSIGMGDSQPAGTPQYMAPEQKDHHRADHRADIYSLGVVLYEMLTGELPADKLQPPSSLVRGVTIDVRLDEIVLRALEKQPEMRFQTATDFRTQVETVSQDRVGKTNERPANPNGTRNVPAAVFLVVYIGYAAFVWASTPPRPEKLAIHFDLDGYPNGWASHSVYLYLTCLFPLLLAGLLWLVSRLAIRFPSLVNIPRRDYWLAPERRRQTASLLLRWYLGLVSYLTVLLAGLHALVLQANLVQPPRLSVGSLLAGAIMLLIGIMVWLATFLMRFAQTGGSVKSREKSLRTSKLRRRLNVVATGITIVVVARAFFVGAFVVRGTGAAPEIPPGSRILVWKPSRVFVAGDLIAYAHDRLVYVGRVVSEGADGVLVNRNGQPDEAVPKSRIVGKVISVYWRGEATSPAPGGGLPAPGRVGEKVIQKFTSEDRTISADVHWSQDGGSSPSLSLDRTERGNHPPGPRVVRLYEVSNPEVEDCTVLYRAKLKTKALEGRAYLEMWCRFPGMGEAFSRGLDQTVSGSNDWVSCQIPFFLKKGEKPDLIRLNVVIDGDGEVRASDISLVAVPSVGTP